MPDSERKGMCGRICVVNSFRARHPGGNPLSPHCRNPRAAHETGLRTEMYTIAPLLKHQNTPYVLRTEEIG